MNKTRVISFPGTSDGCFKNLFFSQNGTKLPTKHSVGLESEGWQSFCCSQEESAAVLRLICCDVSYEATAAVDFQNVMS